MREDICFYVSPANRARLERLVADRNTPRKVVWTKTADAILEKYVRARAALDAVKTGNQALESEH
jgi:hypothetical protein